jgi:pimeloyl-ACP methyl ester carboxylesterase
MNSEYDILNFVQRKEIQVNDMDLTYYDEGEGEIIVFFPGTNAEPRMHYIFFQYLNNCRLITIAHPDVEEFDDVIEIYHQAILKIVGDQKFILGGISVGGFITQYYVEKYPENIKAIILSNSFHDNDLLNKVGTVSENLSKYIPEDIFVGLFVEGVKVTLSLLDVPDNIKNDYVKMLKEMGKETIISRFRWSTMKRDPAELPKELPKQIIYASNDMIIPIFITNKMKKQYPEATVNSLGMASHLSYLTKPEKFAEVIQDFIVNLSK